MAGRDAFQVILGRAFLQGKPDGAKGTGKTLAVATFYQVVQKFIYRRRRTRGEGLNGY